MSQDHPDPRPVNLFRSRANLCDKMAYTPHEVGSNVYGMVAQDSAGINALREAVNSTQSCTTTDGCRSTGS